MIARQYLESNMSSFFHILIIMHRNFNSNADHILHELIIVKTEINK